MKVKILLILVIVYLAGAFSWWTYSLLSLSRSDFEAKNRNMLLAAALAEVEITQNAPDFLSANGTPVQAGSQSLLLDTTRLRAFAEARFGKEYELVFVPSSAGVLAFEVRPGKGKVAQNQRELRTRKRAYYSEGIFFMLLLSLGIVWVFRSINKIIDLNRLQHNFTMSVTHELRTPVAAIKLMMQTLRKHNLDENRRQEIIAKSEQNADRLAKLIEELLMAAKIERKTLEIAFQWVETEEVITELKEEFEALPEFKGEINIQIPAGFRVWGDRLSLKTVFSNLMENAIKYGGNPLFLSITADSEKKTLSFADSGEGIPPQERKKIFRQFYRIGDESVRTSKGTGIGLFLVKNILKIHKARITAQSNRPKGTVFKITFKQK